VIDRLAARIEADRVVRGRHDDALDPGAARRLEHVVEADDVALEDVLPGIFAGDAAEMHDAVDAGDHLLDRRHIGDIGLVDTPRALVSAPGRAAPGRTGAAPDRLPRNVSRKRAADAAMPLLRPVFR
jgi:hypothetical protein